MNSDPCRYRKLPPKKISRVHQLFFMWAEGVGGGRGGEGVEVGRGGRELGEEGSCGRKGVGGQ